MAPSLINSTEEILLVTRPDGKPTNLSLTEDGLHVVKPAAGIAGRFKPKAGTTYSIPHLHLLSASLSASTNKVTVAFVRVLSPTTSKLVKLVGAVPGLGEVTSVKEHVEQWCKAFMEKAYKDTSPNRRLLVLVNPIGGPGKARTIWEEKVEPLFAAAGCEVDLRYTGAPGTATQAKTIAHTLPLDAHDAIVSISGDGIIHEVLNGLASRVNDASEALAKLPVVPIPAGSGNALSVNLNGPKRAGDLVWAALAAVKGKSIPLDLSTVTQSDKEYYAFLTAATGLMADLDLGTEHLRWMGDTRFTVGYIQGALGRRKYPVEILLNVVDSDKATMASRYNSNLRTPQATLSAKKATAPPLEYGTSTSPLPEGVMIHNDLPERLEPGWHLLKTDVFFFYAGKLPWIAKDIQMFPVANIAGESLIDVVVLPPMPPVEALTAMDGTDSGGIFYNPRTRYYKATCVRYTALSNTALVSMDGEDVSNAPFQMESWGGAAKVLALNGWYKEELKQK